MALQRTRAAALRKRLGLQARGLYLEFLCCFLQVFWFPTVHEHAQVTSSCE